jgi:putative ABC transport system ATP-binding protein
VTGLRGRPPARTLPLVLIRDLSLARPRRTNGRMEPAMSDVVTAPTARLEQKAAARTEEAVKVYGKAQTEVRALDGVSVEFASGHFTAVMGPSGSGKSTLLHCTAGLDSLTSGRAFIGDADLSTLDDQRLTILRRDRVGFVFQAFNLVPTISAAQNITLPLLLAGRKGDQAWIAKVIEITGIGDRLEHRPSELSGGQQQRVAVARALASKPGIIFADEPTGNLDSRAGAEVLTFLRRAVDEMGQTIVMVTHDPMAASYADRIVFLADGRIVDEMREPTAERVLERMSRFGE